VNVETTRLDGNAIAGVLHEAFGIEMTTVRRVCPSCHAVNAVGAYYVYRGAGTVLRCPACSDVALTFASVNGRHLFRLIGTWTLDLPAA
jgi:hypothetical protein